MNNDRKKVTLNINPSISCDVASAAANLGSPVVNLPSEGAEVVFTPKHRLARSPVRQGPFVSTPRPGSEATDESLLNLVGETTIITRARLRALSLEEGRKNLEFEQGIENSLAKLRDLRTDTNLKVKSQELSTLNKKVSGKVPLCAKPFLTLSDQITDRLPQSLGEDRTLTQSQILFPASDQTSVVSANSGTTEGGCISTQQAYLTALTSEDIVEASKASTVVSNHSKPPEPLSPKVIINQIEPISKVTEVVSPSSDKDYQILSKPTTKDSGCAIANPTIKLSPKMDTTIAEAKTAAMRPAVPTFLSPQTYHPSRGLASSFIGNYERSSIANGWDNTLKIAYFGSFLEGAANLWYKLYSENPANNQKTWDNIKDDFLAEFGDPDITKAIKSRLENRKQLPNEKVKDFFYELSMLYYEYDQTMNDESFIDYFEKGLTERSGYHYYWLTHPPNTKPTTLEEIKELAITIDKAPPIVGVLPVTPPVLAGPTQRNIYPQVFNRGNGNGAPRPPMYRPSNTNGRYYNQGTGQSRNPVPRANTTYSNQGQYNRQGSNTNYTRPQKNTPNFQQSNQKSRTFNNRPRCFTCSGIGHYASACPNFRGRQN